MQAGLVTGKHAIEFVELPDPEPEPQKAVVEIAYCGICGTDLHAYQSGEEYNPAICGHEWTGVVSACGDGVTNVREGDRVGIGIAPACGQCDECRAGKAAQCSRALTGLIGLGPLAAPHGGFAPAIAIEAARLYTLRKGISDEDAAVLEPSTVAVHALRRIPIRLGDSALVLGAGPIGLLTLQCARAAGIGHIVVVEPDATRAQLASEVGADAIIDPNRENTADRALQECGALGPDIVFECAGVPATINQSVELVRRGGTVAMVGLAGVPAQISPGTWLMKEVRLLASLGYLHEEFDIAMQLVADGRLRVAPLVTSTVGLKDLQPAFDRLLRLDKEVKILVDPRV
jgi:(R,R)-butanediol dehydrogenase/meso-butanediol dehydrogenase/diacetyl reductase